jgi:hypothetical protein
VGPLAMALMSQKSIGLKIQTARDTLAECITELKDALEEIDEIEDAGNDTPVASGDVERVLAQGRALLKKLETWTTRF